MYIVIEVDRVLDVSGKAIKFFHINCLKYTITFILISDKHIFGQSFKKNYIYPNSPPSITILFMG